MEKKITNEILKLHNIDVPDQIISLIISFDVEKSFEIWFNTNITKIDFIMNINYVSFYEDILSEFQEKFYKHCKGSEIIFKAKCRKMLEKKIKKIIINLKLNQ